MVTIEIKKNTVFVVLAFAVVLAGVFIINAVAWTTPTSGVWHEARETRINTSSGYTDLQSAYDDIVLSISGRTICSEAPDFDSTPDTVKVARTINLAGTPCLTEVGCVIKQEIYKGTTLKLRRQCSFNQEADNSWWSSCVNPKVYINGNTNEEQIISSYHGIYLYDDLVNNNPAMDEKSNTLISAMDTSTGTTGYSQKIYLCSYA